MSDDELKKAEQRGYARGYAAGRKRVHSDRALERYQREQQAFLDKAFLAALPFAMEQSTWTKGEKPISALDERVGLAWNVAEAALKYRRYA